MGLKNDLTGKRYGKLTVMGFSHKDVKKHKKSENKPFITTYYWKCKCDCGNTTLVSSSNLTSGNTKSCGCYKKELIAKKNTKQGFVFPVLDTSKKTIGEEYFKFKEEVKELDESVLTYSYGICGGLENRQNKEHMLEECFDTIQVIVNLIDKLGITSKEKQDAYMRHIDKMIQRGWSIKTYI